MREFRFFGEIEASKSLLNRWLILRSFEPGLEILSKSNCDDVLLMEKALQDLASPEFDAGAAGTVFRFLAFRLSRLHGEFHIRATKRLAERPHGPLLEILQVLGVEAELTDEGLSLKSQGWKNPGILKIDRSVSSQFATGLALSAIELDFDLEFEMSDESLSESYWQMTLSVLKEAGIRVRKLGSTYRIAAGQKVQPKKVTVEADMSSAFAVAALASVAGVAHIENFNDESTQPDAVFVEILREMGAAIDLREDRLVLSKGKALKGVECNLSQAPDLFPVLAVLCALAHGRSNLYGATQLAYKESSRIQSVADLLAKMGARFESKEDGMIIHGPARAKTEFVFNPKEDHRLVMAAGLAKWAGFPVRIENQEAVNKSFPQYRELAL